MNGDPGFVDVQSAAGRIGSAVRRTPVLTSRVLDEELGCELFFKCENLQEIGAFKARGATNAVFALSDEVAARGVVTHSSGNHGAALAFAAQRRGIPCAIVIPTTAPPVKRQNIERFGAEIVVCEPGDREATCVALAERRGAYLVHPFEDPYVIAGQGTAALELCDEIEELDLFVTPVGGGGLLSGTAITVNELRPGARVLGAEPLAVDDAARSMATGVRQPTVFGQKSACDGLMTGIGERNFRLMTRLGVEVATADEPSIQRAAIDLCRRLRVVVEPSAAVTLAVLRSLQGQPGEPLRGRRVGVILSGGNTDFSFLCALVREVRGACPASAAESSH